MAIPMSSGGPRKFRFKTAPLRGGEGQGKGNLECVHQAMEPPRQHQVGERVASDYEPVGLYRECLVSETVVHDVSSGKEARTVTSFIPRTLAQT